MPRGTRRIIKDHVDKAINHVGSAVGQLRVAMETGEERSLECAILIPELITMLLEQMELIETVKQKL